MILVLCEPCCSCSLRSAMALLITLAFFLLCVLVLPATTSDVPCLGVTYSATSQFNFLPPKYLVLAAVESINMRSLRLEDSDPTIIRSFFYTNVSLFLTIPNYLVPAVGANRSFALHWLYVHVVPFYPRAKISTISIGNDFIDVFPNKIHYHYLLQAIKNVHFSLKHLGIGEISVSTSFSFVSVISNPFPPSAAKFREPPDKTLFPPLLRFLRDTNSSFLINVYPYNLYRLNPEFTLGFALFQETAFNFRDDFTTGSRYRNLFEMMIDSVVNAMAVAGYENIPIIVTETGWPSFSLAPNEMDANMLYAEIYHRGLVKHLLSGKGTPMRKEGVKEVFIYELFDEGLHFKGKLNSPRRWGILYPNITKKFDFMDFSSGSGSESHPPPPPTSTKIPIWIKILCFITFLLYLALLAYIQIICK